MVNLIIINNNCVLIKNISKNVNTRKFKSLALCTTADAWFYKYTNLSKQFLWINKRNDMCNNM